MTAVALGAGRRRAPVAQALGQRAAALTLALAVDRIVGEPPDAVHPVAIFGDVMERVEDRLWADSRAAGILYTTVGVAASAAAGVLVTRFLRARGSSRWPGEVLSAGAASYIAIAGRDLGRRALAVRGALGAGDLEQARGLLPALVGRDPSVLDGEGICRAVIESVAENTVDAVVAPIFWAMVGGAPGVLAYRAVNTLDAMVGYRNQRYDRFGWASARLDDVLNYIPARWTALLVRRSVRWEGTEIADALRQARSHPSPNAGVAEAAWAGALGVRLGGRTVYPDRTEDRPELGRGRAPEPADIERAVRLSETVARAAVAQCVGVAGGGRWWSLR